MTTPSCRPEAVTAWVDDALDPALRAEVESHLAACPSCREQEAFERGIRARLRTLPAPEPPAGLEARVRRRASRPPRRMLPAWIGVAAGLLLAALWLRSSAPFVAWELALDHAHCFSKERLPAQVFTEDPAQLAHWFAERDVEMPMVPAAAGGLELVGGRFCPLADRRVAHVYYVGDAKRLSLYVVPGTVRGPGGTRQAGRRRVHFLRTGGQVIGLVSEDPKSLKVFQEAFSTTVAAVDPARPPLLGWLVTPVGL